jgi:hypothetical protein
MDGFTSELATTIYKTYGANLREKNSTTNIIFLSYFGKMFSKQGNLTKILTINRILIKKYHQNQYNR